MSTPDREATCVWNCTRQFPHKGACHWVRAPETESPLEWVTRVEFERDEARRERDVLLAALKQIDRMADDWHGPCPNIQRVAQAAIAKAEGNREQSPGSPASSVPAHQQKQMVPRNHVAPSGGGIGVTDGLLTRIGGEIDNSTRQANHYTLNTTPKAREVAEFWRGRVAALAEVKTWVEESK